MKNKNTIRKYNKAVEELRKREIFVDYKDRYQYVKPTDEKKYSMYKYNLRVFDIEGAGMLGDRYCKFIVVSVCVGNRGASCSISFLADDICLDKEQLYWLHRFAAACTNLHRGESLWANTTN